MSGALGALYAGDVEKAQALLPADGELNVFEAAAFGRVHRLRSILDDDASQANAFSDDDFTALHLAVFAKQEEAARTLIEHGADLNARSRGTIARVPPLGTAAFVRSVPLARLLLDAGADVNGQGEGGVAALHTAAHNGDEKLVDLLLERGADRSLTTTSGKTTSRPDSGERQAPQHAEPVKTDGTSERARFPRAPLSIGSSPSSVR